MLPFACIFSNGDIFMRLSAKLQKMGVGKGSRVALWGYNSANWLIAFFSIVRAGGTAVLVNYSMSSGDAADLLPAVLSDYT